MWRVIFDLILPRRCHCCGSDLRDQERGICSACSEGLPLTGYHKHRDNPMEQRLAGRTDFERATSYLFYSPDSVVARLIHDFKYHGFQSLARDLGVLMGEDLKRSGWLEGIDYVMGVPLHWRRRMTRGYCQTHELACGIGEVTGAKVSSDLKAFAGHRSQTRLSHEERLKNVEGIFRLVHGDRYAGKTILLVDDVCTTGGTLSAAGRAIRAGCADCRIVILTLATIF